MADASEVNLLQVVREVIAPFAHSRETRREMGAFANAPEDDVFYVMVEMRDYWKLLVLAGAVDRESLEALPEKARPSNEFLVKIERLVEKIAAVT